MITINNEKPSVEKNPVQFDLGKDGEKTENNQLEIIIKDSGLDTTKARYILDKFQDSFELADHWTKIAKTIVVTGDDQKEMMQKAREGRLALRDKRLQIEKSRKELKEQALREGKAIDGIANVLKALFAPLEEYLDSQERFTEIKIEKEAARLVSEAEAKAQADLLAKQEADRKELERLRIETERQKKENEEKERLLKIERDKAEAERKKQADILAQQKAEADRKAREEKAKQEAVLKAERDRAEQEKKEVEEKARKQKDALKAKEEAERLEKERLQDILEKKITCPHCGKKFKLEQ